MATEAPAPETSEMKKSKRVRKKRLYAAIMEQMEFYFSDANLNLTRDKYLRSLMENDKFVPLSEFLQFGQISSMSATTEDLVNALSTSQFLQVSPDGSAVCRRSPFVPKEDVELCTIYVESIPRSSGREALRRTFSAYGTVDYVSLPKHRTTGLHRGFGFAQFRTPNMAHNALHAFGALGRRMPSEHYPEYLSEPGVDHAADADAEEMEMAAAAAAAAAAAEGPTGGAAVAVTEDMTSRPGKRKLSTDSCSRDAPMKMTRFADTPESGSASATTATATAPAAAAAAAPAPSASATPADTDHSNLSECAADGTTSCSEPHREDASMGTSLLTEQTDDTDLSGAEARRARRRRRTRRGRRAPLADTEDTRLLGLQIMPLSEWSRFREQYRALQKENMSEIKQALRQRLANRPAPPPPASDAPARSVGAAPQFVPGTVVRFTATRPVGATDKQLIESLKRRPGVLYVELGDGADPSYLRLETAAVAVSCLTDPELKDAAVLRGGDEENYWRRLLEARSATRSRRARSKERGRDRLLRRLRAGDCMEA